MQYTMDKVASAYSLAEKSAGLPSAVRKGGGGVYGRMLRATADSGKRSSESVARGIGTLTDSKQIGSALKAFHPMGQRVTHAEGRAVLKAHKKAVKKTAAAYEQALAKEAAPWATLKAVGSKALGVGERRLSGEALKDVGSLLNGGALHNTGNGLEGGAASLKAVLPHMSGRPGMAFAPPRAAFPPRTGLAPKPQLGVGGGTLPPQGK